MAVYSQTPILKLAQYAGQDIPTFLEDMSDSFIKIDRAFTDVKESNDKVIEYLPDIEGFQNAYDEIKGYVPVIEQNNQLVEDLKQDVAKLQGDVDLLQPAKVEDLEKRMDLVEAVQITNSNLIEGLTTRLSDDEDNLSQHAIRLDNLEKAVATNDTVIKDLTASFDDFMSDTNDSIADINNNVSDINTKLEESGTKQDDFNKLLESLNESVLSINQQLNAISAQITNLQDRMTYSESKIIELEGKINGAN